eukprot:TRINITY_DN7009_c0_g1_i1.p2 TRINITY_DN7009_c0_g1~~TRINITY_DN7009_c0_g1_i1.p2  ORF type:complete len:110 (+),score=13.06 TRINITY_DN7009_c0_g1_i1:173-502(+)
MSALTHVFCASAAVAGCLATEFNKLVELFGREIGICWAAQRAEVMSISRQEEGFISAKLQTKLLLELERDVIIQGEWQRRLRRIVCTEFSLDMVIDCIGFVFWISSFVH